jgi:hypothetical protein
VHDLSLGIFTTLFGLTVSEVHSSATITGDFNALNAVGSVSLVNGSASSGISSQTLASNPAANTHIDVLSLFGLAGISLTLNEQILTGDGLTSRGLEVNAIHLGFANFSSGAGVLNGDIIISHSAAQVQAQSDPVHALPEPATLALEALALTALPLFRRRNA